MFRKECFNELAGRIDDLSRQLYLEGAVKQLPEPPAPAEASSPGDPSASAEVAPVSMKTTAEKVAQMRKMVGSRSRTCSNSETESEVTQDEPRSQIRTPGVKSSEWSSQGQVFEAWLWFLFMFAWMICIVDSCILGFCRKNLEPLEPKEGSTTAWNSSFRYHLVIMETGTSTVWLPWCFLDNNGELR